MSVRTSRPRNYAALTFGLRMGRRRDSHLKWLQAHPEAAAGLQEILHRVREDGYEPADMSRVREPFDHDRRRATGPRN